MPRLFEEAVAAMTTMAWRPELVIEELPAPQKIAPFAVAVSAEVVVHEAELGSGRLVLLHDPGGNPSWDGDFRCVTYARADVDAEMVADPLPQRGQRAGGLPPDDIVDVLEVGPDGAHQVAVGVVHSSPLAMVGGTVARRAGPVPTDRPARARVGVGGDSTAGSWW